MAEAAMTAEAELGLLIRLGRFLRREGDDFSVKSNPKHAAFKKEFKAHGKASDCGGKHASGYTEARTLFRICMALFTLFGGPDAFFAVAPYLVLIDVGSGVLEAGKSWAFIH
jgi:hypothetical protein